MTISWLANKIEQWPAYVDVAVERWQDFTGGGAVLEGDGRTFNEVAQDETRACA